MLVLLDRNFDVAALIATLAATNAHLLVRLKANRKLPVLRRYHDGSYLSQIGTTASGWSNAKSPSPPPLAGTPASTG
jgi:hypothetical protein